MELTTSEKIRTVLMKKKLTIAALADLLGQSRQNFSNKLSRDNFSIDDVKEIAKVLDIEFEYNFVLSDGTKI